MGSSPTPTPASECCCRPVAPPGPTFCSCSTPSSPWNWPRGLSSHGGWGAPGPGLGGPMSQGWELGQVAGPFGSQNTAHKLQCPLPAPSKASPTNRLQREEVAENLTLARHSEGSFSKNACGECGNFSPHGTHAHAALRLWPSSQGPAETGFLRCPGRGSWGWEKVTPGRGADPRGSSGRAARAELRAAARVGFSEPTLRARRAPHPRLRCLTR